MKGVGKSCLVARAVERARQHGPGLGMVVLHRALDDMAVLAAFQQLAVDHWGDAEAEKLLANKDLPVLQRVRRVLALWRTRPVVLILDDFEQNLEARSDGPARLHSYAAELLDVLLPACKLGKPKLLITTTAVFEAPAAHAAALGELRLGTLELASVRKLWIRGPSASAHISVSLAHWEKLATRLGNNARILSWARDLLAGKTSGEMEKIAARAAEQMPVWEPGDEVRQEKHDELARLFLRHMSHEEARAAVGPDALEFLRRARVFEVAVPAEALAELTEGLAIDPGRDFVALANLGLLEVGELDSQRAYRVSPLVEPTFTAERPELWHGVASRFWWKVADGGKAASEYLERVQRSWRHALAGRHTELAERAGRVIDFKLFQAGLYVENQHRADEHLAALPETPFAARWAGEVESYTVGPTPRARALLEACLRGYVEMHGSEKHPDYTSALHALGGVVHAQGDLQGARHIFERALALHAEVHGSETNLSFAASLHALGRVLYDLGDLESAHDALQRSLSLQTELQRIDTPLHIGVTLQVLGDVLLSKKDLAAAKAAYERSLAMKLKAHGTDKHPEIATGLHGLGCALFAQGNLTAARSSLERAVAIRSEVFGTEEHPDAAATLQMLGCVFWAQRDLSAARRAFERSIAIDTKVKGTDVHPSVADTLGMLGLVLREQGQISASHKSLERAHVIREKLAALATKQA